MKIFLNLALLAAFAYVAWDFYADYRDAVGSTWQRLLAAGKTTATILWSRFTILVTALSNSLVWLAGLLGAPGVEDAIKAALQPVYVAGFVVVIAIITELARRRTL